MTQTNSFLETLRNAHRNRPTELQGLMKLKEFCAGITAYIGGHVDCSPVPGIATSYGLEFKVILTFIPSAYSITLLRAYLKPDQPPYLDANDGNAAQPCVDVDDFSRRLDQFLRVDTVLETLDTYRRWAESHGSQTA